MHQNKGREGSTFAFIGYLVRGQRSVLQGTVWAYWEILYRYVLPPTMYDRRDWITVTDCKSAASGLTGSIPVSCTKNRSRIVAAVFVSRIGYHKQPTTETQNTSRGKLVTGCLLCNNNVLFDFWLRSAAFQAAQVGFKSHIGHQTCLTNASTGAIMIVLKRSDGF